MNNEQPSRQHDKQKDALDLRESSILFGPIAFWFYVACLILAIWFKLLPLLAVSAFLIILSAWIYLWKEKSLKNLELALDPSTTRLFVGEEFKLDATIKNNKWLPLIWIEWQFQSDDIVGWGKKKKSNYTIRFLWLLSFQQVKWPIQGKGLKRGVYPLGKVILRSGDGFRFVEKEKKYDIHHSLYIYPKLVPVQVPMFRPSMQWEVQGKQGGFMEDPLLISGIREYEAGDEWRRFNWRASARTGKMLTNVYQPIVSEQTALYLDVQGFVIDKGKYIEDEEKQLKYEIIQNESFEYFLSIVASFAVAYQERGISIGYASNGLNQTGVKQPYIAPRPQLTAVLDQLAQITQRIVQQKMTTLDEMIHLGARSVPLVIFTKQLTKKDYKWYEQNSNHFDIDFYYMNHSEYAGKIKTARSMQQLLAQTAVN